MRRCARLMFADCFGVAESRLAVGHRAAARSGLDAAVLMIDWIQDHARS